MSGSFVPNDDSLRCCLRRVRLDGSRNNCNIHTDSVYMKSSRNHRLTFSSSRARKPFSPICSQRCSINRSTIGFQRRRLFVSEERSSCSRQNVAKVPASSSWELKFSWRMVDFLHSFMRPSVSSCDLPLRIISCLPFISSSMVRLSLMFSSSRPRHFFRRLSNCFVIL